MKPQNTLFVRVVAQARNRGYMLLCSFDDTVVQRTAIQYVTLGNITRELLDACIGKLKQTHNAEGVMDVTSPGLQRKLEQMFA